MPSTLAAASAGAVLKGRRRNFASTVLDTVIAAVPMTPATRPRPIVVASWLTVTVSSSDEGDRRGPRAGGAAQLGVGQHERELAYVVGGERAQVEVLDDVDAVTDVERLRDEERPVGVLGRDGPVRPRVAAGERDAVLDEPRHELHAWPRL